MRSNEGSLTGPERADWRVEKGSVDGPIETRRVAPKPAGAPEIALDRATLRLDATSGQLDGLGKALAMFMLRQGGSGRMPSLPALAGAAPPDLRASLPTPGAHPPLDAGPSVGGPLIASRQNPSGSPDAFDRPPAAGSAEDIGRGAVPVEPSIVVRGGGPDSPAEGPQSVERTSGADWEAPAFPRGATAPESTSRGGGGEIAAESASWPAVGGLGDESDDDASPQSPEEIPTRAGAFVLPATSTGSEEVTTPPSREFPRLGQVMSSANPPALDGGVDLGASEADQAPSMADMPAPGRESPEYRGFSRHMPPETSSHPATTAVGAGRRGVAVVPSYDFGQPEATGESFAVGPASGGPTSREPGPFAGPMNAPGTTGRGDPAVDLSRTNQLLQQLLDEVRRGRQGLSAAGNRRVTPER